MDQPDQQEPKIDSDPAKKSWHTPTFSRLNGQETSGGLADDDEINGGVVS